MVNFHKKRFFSSHLFEVGTIFNPLEDLKQLNRINEDKIKLFCPSTIGCIILSALNIS